MPVFTGRKAEWNGGYAGAEPIPYTVLSQPDFDAHLARLARPISSNSGNGAQGYTGTVHSASTADCASFQPFPAPYQNQDRYAVHEWLAGDGRWRLWGVFDGHAGHTTVDLTVRTLPQLIMDGITAALTSPPPSSSSSPESPTRTLTPAEVHALLTRTVTAFDDSITAGVHALFPGGVQGLATLSDAQIRAAALVNGAPHPVLARCLTGTTVLIALLDPARNLYVCSLGDCTAVLGRKGEDGAWSTEIVSANHNGRDAGEAARIRAEHPGEPECILDDRVLGGIAVTRAIGDQVFKLPPVYTQRVFDAADPGAYIFSRLAGILERNHTPPYVSNVPEIRHVDLSQYSTDDTILILASDGLADLYEAETSDALEAVAKRWVSITTSAMDADEEGAEERSPALQLLREGMGADTDVEKASWYLTAEMDSPWLDDITIIVDKL